MGNYGHAKLFLKNKNHAYKQKNDPQSDVGFWKEKHYHYFAIK